jgi:dodecin
MTSAYKIVEIIGTSEKSWEDAAKSGIDIAAKSLKELRVAEVKEMDINIEGGKMIYRVKLKLSFKYTD